MFDGLNVMVILDRETQRPTRIPDVDREFLSQFGTFDPAHVMDIAAEAAGLGDQLTVIRTSTPPPTRSHPQRHVLADPEPLRQHVAGRVEPAIPWTPGPGVVAAEHRYAEVPASLFVSHAHRGRATRRASPSRPPLMSPPTRFALCSAIRLAGRAPHRDDPLPEPRGESLELGEDEPRRVDRAVGRARARRPTRVAARPPRVRRRTTPDRSPARRGAQASDRRRPAPPPPPSPHASRPRARSPHRRGAGRPTGSARRAPGRPSPHPARAPSPCSPRPTRAGRASPRMRGSGLGGGVEEDCTGRRQVLEGPDPDAGADLAAVGLEVGEELHS